MLLLGTSKDDARAGLQLAFVADGVSEDGGIGRQHDLLLAVLLFDPDNSAVIYRVS